MDDLDLNILYDALLRKYVSYHPRCIYFKEVNINSPVKSRPLRENVKGNLPLMYT